MAEHLTRKDLRADGFAVAVEHNVEYLAEHRKQAIQYGSIALIAILAGLGIYWFLGQRTNSRQEQLADAIQIQETPVTANATPGPQAFPTDAAKQEAATKAFTAAANNLKGSKEGLIAEYYLGCIASDAGRLDEARTRFQTVADGSDKAYSSLGKYSLAEVNYIQNRDADGEKLLRQLVDNPTVMVSKEQATITLARHIGKTRPAEARKLLEPVARETNAASQAAISALGELK